MTPHTISDDPQTAVILERIDSLRGDVQKLETKMEAQNTSYVAMSVFVAWQTAYDREIRDLKATLVKQEEQAEARAAAHRVEVKELKTAAAKQEQLADARVAALRAELTKPSQVPIWVGMALAILTSATALIAVVSGG